MALAGIGFMITACQTTASTAPTKHVVYPDGISFYEGRIYSDFGATAGRKWPHGGIDIRGNRRQPIIAIADGVVEAVAYGFCHGHLLVVDHGRDLNGGRLYATYLHIAGSLVERGQEVRRGDLVAWLDGPPPDSDCGSQRHLHLELSNNYSPQLFGGSQGNPWYHAEGSEQNPHLLWADGPYRVTCFDPEREHYPEGTITYPIRCDWQIHTIEDLLGDLSSPPVQG